MLLNKTNLVLIFSVLAVSACTSNEIGESKDVAQDKIFQQYSVKYTEGDENVTVTGQFRFAGGNGTTLVLTKPSQLAFDDEVIKVDSSGASGAYYQAKKAASGFNGKHHFDFTDINNKKFDNDFDFQKFQLANAPMEASKKSNLNIEFSPKTLNDGDYVEIKSANTDSSFSVRLDGKNDAGAIQIPAKELMRQKKGEVKLEVTLYRNVNLQQDTAEGGSMEIRYTLKPITVKLND